MSVRGRPFFATGRARRCPLRRFFNMESGDFQHSCAVACIREKTEEA